MKLIHHVQAHGFYTQPQVLETLNPSSLFNFFYIVHVLLCLYYRFFKTKFLRITHFQCFPSLLTPMLSHVHISYYLYIPIYNTPKPLVHVPQPHSLHVMEDSSSASQATTIVDTKVAIMTPWTTGTTFNSTFLEVVLNLHQPQVIFTIKFNKNLQEPLSSLLEFHF